VFPDVKIEVKETAPVFFVLGAAFALVALLGVNPVDRPNKLDSYAKAGLGFLTVLFFACGFRAERASARPVPPLTPEYRENFASTQQAVAEAKQLVPDFEILGTFMLGNTKFDVLHGDITKATTEIVVSSDDNHFTAGGGVAKAINEKAGPDIQRELERVRQFRFRQGHLAVTTGGNWKCRALIHAITVDLNEHRFATEAVIRELTRRTLDCAVALGAASVAFPVLGGGTAAEHIEPKDSVRWIVTEVLEFLQQHHANANVSLTYVVLYIFQREHAKGLLGTALEKASGDEDHLRKQASPRN